MQRLIDADALVYDEIEPDCLVVFKSDIDRQPTIEAIPIEFIQKRIDQLKEMNGRIFIANGGYTSPSDYEQWELERLIRDWREQSEERKKNDKTI